MGLLPCIVPMFSLCAFNSIKRVMIKLGTIKDILLDQPIGQSNQLFMMVNDKK